ncbi:MAG: hypothetical protein AAF989_09900 [Planctomycetota bacterium]
MRDHAGLSCLQDWMRLSFLCWMAVACTASSSAYGNESATDPSTDSAGVEDRVALEEMVACLIQQHRSLESITLTYRELSRQSQDADISNGYLRRKLSARGPRYFYRDNGHGHARLDWRFDPQRKTLAIRPDGNLLLENLNRIIVDSGIPKDSRRVAPYDVENELFFLAFCWWPYSDWNCPEVFDRPWDLEQLLRSGDYWIRGPAENVGGGDCVILELPEKDRLWVEREYPHRMFRREVVNPETGRLAMRFLYEDYTLIGNDVWLPKRFTNQQFDSFSGFKDRKVIDSSFEIEECRINGDVLDQDFTVQIQPGTVRQKKDAEANSLAIVRPGEQAHLDSINRWFFEHAEFNIESRTPFDVRKILVWFSIGISVSAILNWRLTTQSRRARDLAASVPTGNNPKVGS